jgi:hypothetical protein
LVALSAYRITRHLRSGEAVRADALKKVRYYMVFFTRHGSFFKGTEQMQKEVSE